MRDGTILRHAVQWDMTRTAPEGFGRAFDAVDVAVIEATGNSMGVRLLSPSVVRAGSPTPYRSMRLQTFIWCVTVDARKLPNPCAVGRLPKILTRRPSACGVRRPARPDRAAPNRVHAILAAHLVPTCPNADFSNQRGRAWLVRRIVPEDEPAAIERVVGELDRSGKLRPT